MRVRCRVSAPRAAAHHDLASRTMEMSHDLVRLDVRDEDEAQRSHTLAREERDLQASSLGIAELWGLSAPMALDDLCQCVGDGDRGVGAPAARERSSASGTRCRSRARRSRARWSAELSIALATFVRAVERETETSADQPHDDDTTYVQSEVPADRSAGQSPEDGGGEASAPALDERARGVTHAITEGSARGVSISRTGPRSTGTSSSRSWTP